jgi:hypothetical protein
MTFRSIGVKTQRDVTYSRERSRLGCSQPIWNVITPDRNAAFRSHLSEDIEGGIE